MSFSKEIKSEILLLNEKSRHDRLAALSAFVLFSGKLMKIDGKSRFFLDTLSDPIFSKYFTLLKKTININSIDDRLLTAETSKNLFEALRLKDIDSIEDGNIAKHFSRKLIDDSSSKKAFLRNAFLISGSVTDPNKSYMFSIVVKEKELADIVQDIFSFFELNAKVSFTAGNFTVYIKDSTEVGEAVALIGASKAYLSFENVRILKEISSNVNRTVNCDTYNIGKSVNAGLLQVEDIKLIDSKIGLENLPGTLQDIPNARLQNPTPPLAELGGKLEKPLSKSGVNHRMMRLREIAKGLRIESSEV